MNNNLNSFGYIIKNTAKFLAVSFFISGIIIVILSVILCYTQISEKIINPSIIFLSNFSIIIGSFLLGKKLKEKGLIYGGIFGITYVVGLYLISSFVSFDFSIRNWNNCDVDNWNLLWNGWWNNWS